MKSVTQYYLFKSGTLVGPITEEKLKQLQTSGEILRYSWIINNNEQTWAPITSSPAENPFQSTQKTLGARDLSGVFVFMNRPYLGIVKGIHSFGVEVLLKERDLKSNSIPADTVLQLNLADETHGNAVNTQVIFQSMENHVEGVILRLGWATAPVQL